MAGWSQSSEQHLALPKPNDRGSIQAPLHSVIFEDLFAGGTQPGALHLKALLDRTVVTEVLSAKTRRIARACGLFLLSASMLR